MNSLYTVISNLGAYPSAWPQEVAAFIYGASAAACVRVFRAVLRWVKRVSNARNSAE